MADGTKVGDVYVEGRLEYDRSSTAAFAGALQKDLERSVDSRGLSNKIRDSLYQGTFGGIRDGVRDGLQQRISLPSSFRDGVRTDLHDVTRQGIATGVNRGFIDGYDNVRDVNARFSDEINQNLRASIIQGIDNGFRDFDRQSLDRFQNEVTALQGPLRDNIKAGVRDGIGDGVREAGQNLDLGQWRESVKVSIRDGIGDGIKETDLDGFGGRFTSVLRNSLSDAFGDFDIEKDVDRQVGAGFPNGFLQGGTQGIPPISSDPARTSLTGQLHNGFGDSISSDADQGIDRGRGSLRDLIQRAVSGGVTSGIGDGINSNETSDALRGFKIKLRDGMRDGLNDGASNFNPEAVRTRLHRSVADGIGDGVREGLNSDSFDTDGMRDRIHRSVSDGIGDGVREGLDRPQDLNFLRDGVRNNIRDGIGDGLREGFANNPQNFESMRNRVRTSISDGIGDGINEGVSKVDFGPLRARISSAVGDGMNEGVDNFNAERVRTRLHRSVSDGIGDGVDEGFRGVDHVALAAPIRTSLGSGVKGGFGDGINEGRSIIRNDAGELGREGGGTFGKGFGDGFGAWAGQSLGLFRAALMGLIMPAIQAVLAAIEGSLMLLPALLASIPPLVLGIAAAGGVVAVAFAGVASAAKAAFSNPLTAEGTKKFEEDIAGLGASVQALARDIRANAVPAFNEFKNAVQNTFAEHFIGLASRFAGFLRGIQAEANGVADAFGRLGRSIADALTSSVGIRATNVVLREMNNMVTVMTPSVNRLMFAFLGLAGQARGFGTILGELISKGLDKISHWMETTDLRQVWENAKPALEDLRRIAVALWNTLKNLFMPNTEQMRGGGFLELMADLAEVLERASVKVRVLLDGFLALNTHLPFLIPVILGIVAGFKLFLALGAGVLRVVNLMSSLGGAISAVTSGMGLLSLVSNPVGIVLLIVAGAVAILAGAFLLAWTQSEEFRNIIKSVIPLLGQMLGPALTEFGNAMKLAFGEMGRLLKEADIDWARFGRAVARGLIIATEMLIFFIQVATFLMNGLAAMLHGASIAVRMFRDGWNSDWNIMRVVLEAVWGGIGFIFSLLIQGFQAIIGGLGNLGVVWDAAWRGMQAVASFFAESFRAIGNAIGVVLGAIGAGVQGLASVWSAAWGLIRNASLAAAEFFAGTVGGIFRQAIDGLRGFMAGLAQWFADRWNDIRNVSQAAAEFFASSVGGLFREAIEGLRGFMTGLVSWFSDRWNDIRNVSMAAAEFFAGSVGGLFREAVDGLKGFMQGLSNFFGDRFQDIKNITLSAAEHFAGVVGNLYREAVDGLKGFMQGLSNFFGDRFQDIKNITLSAAEHFAGVVGNIFRQAVDGLKGFAQGLSNFWGDRFQDIKNIGQSAADFFSTTVLSRFQGFFSALQGATETFRQAWANAWNVIRDTVKAPIGAIVNFIRDPLVKGYNIIAKHVKLPEIQFNVAGFARGGVVPGVGSKDSVPALLTPGEGILTKREMKLLGGPAGFAALRSGLNGNASASNRSEKIANANQRQRKELLPQYAKGGIVETIEKIFGALGSFTIPGGVAGVTGEQLGNAAAIIGKGQSMGVGPRGWIIAIATALQESGLRNLNYGDRDSVGLFQQRPSQGWGSVDQIMNPAYSAGKFFERLPKGGLGGSLSAIAQSIQRSAFPDAYAKWEGTATAIVSAFLGGADFAEFARWFSDPIGAFIEGMMKELPKDAFDKVGDFGAILFKMAETLVKGAAEHVLESFKAGLLGAAGGTPGQFGTGVNAIIALVQRLAKESGAPMPPVTSAQRSTPDYHGQGRAVDFGGFNQDKLASALFGVGGSLLELIHTTNTRGYYIKNGKPISSYGAATDAAHRNHIHVAMDNGGVIPSGTGAFIKNSTSEAEYALTKSHMQDLFGDSGEDGHVINVFVDGVRRDARIEVKDAFGKTARKLTGRGRGR